MNCELYFLVHERGLPCFVLSQSHATVTSLNILALQYRTIQAIQYCDYFQNI
ncbi:hypothetical protein ACQ27_gp307 [Klebsiella phage K64-1]|uniref:hypothetical protein n=1 Tax=Klebsiella phage K64-1 TaxID=1439894 RepID=UPI00248CBCF7|nr:hypothetical protein ACQ27_gp307 [Klebsiella phage K64-1]